jgi:hypothetical protein
MESDEEGLPPPKRPSLNPEEGARASEVQVETFVKCPCKPGNYMKQSHYSEHCKTKTHEQYLKKISGPGPTAKRVGRPRKQRTAPEVAEDDVRSAPPPAAAAAGKKAKSNIDRRSRDVTSTSSSKDQQPEIEEKSFQTLFTLNIDPAAQKPIWKNQGQSSWREYVGKKPKEMPKENWMTKLFDSLNSPIIIMPAHWAQKYYFHMPNHTRASSNHSELFATAWRSALIFLVKTLNDSKLMSLIESGDKRPFYTYARILYVSFSESTTIDDLLTQLDRVGVMYGEVCDWARTSKQVNCPISQMPLEKPVWLSRTGRTYSMDWLVNAIKKAFSEEMPLRLEDTTLYYYDLSSETIDAHPYLPYFSNLKRAISSFRAL